MASALRPRSGRFAGRDRRHSATQRKAVPPWARIAQQLGESCGGILPRTTSWLSVVGVGMRSESGDSAPQSRGGHRDEAGGDATECRTVNERQNPRIEAGSKVGFVEEEPGSGSGQPREQRRLTLMPQASLVSQVVGGEQHEGSPTHGPLHHHGHSVHLVKVQVWDLLEDVPAPGMRAGSSRGALAVRSADAG